MSTKKISSLSLRKELAAAMELLGYEEMTPVQQQALPIVIDGKDVLVQAETGSGKTAAFAIGVLNKLREQDYVTQGLIVCPTRELADQVAAEIRRLAKVIANVKVLTLCGGKPFGPQLVSLKRAPHIIVGTPGRLLKHLQKESLNLGTLETLVLDEADRMLDMGFSEDIEKIIAYAPEEKQTLLFSATYPGEIELISREIQVDAVSVKITPSLAKKAISQVFYETANRARTQSLVRVLQHYQPESTLVFCNTIETCEKVARELNKDHFHALALHGDLEQFKRDQYLERFSNRSVSVLIATDVAARGIDIKELDAVVNFELSRDPEVHVHRIGRTGRAGSEGLAVSLFSAEDHSRLRAIEQYLDTTVLKKNTATLNSTQGSVSLPATATLLISAGRRNKLRPGDILGALTSSLELSGDQIGKITLFDKVSYVAVNRAIADLAVSVLVSGKIKGRSVRVKRLG